jgi:hypothetical protein
MFTLNILAVFLTTTQLVGQCTKLARYNGEESVVYELQNSRRLQFDDFHHGITRHSHPAGTMDKDFVSTCFSAGFGLSEREMTLDFFYHGLSDQFWTAFLGYFSQSWTLKYKFWNEVMVFFGAGADDDHETITLVANRRPTKEVLQTTLNVWLNGTRRSKIDYLKLSCLQRLQEDFNYECSCKTWKKNRRRLTRAAAMALLMQVRTATTFTPSLTIHLSIPDSCVKVEH